MKLWQKENTTVPEIIEKFTVGRDKEFDLMMAKHDVVGSIAHVKMLVKAGLLTEDESVKAVKVLEEILGSIAKGKFSISDNIEDVHSQVEFMLTEKIGDIGKKIHSGRSRNDQVATDIKLYLREQILLVRDETKELFDLLISLSEKYKSVLLPGYTHLQIAMPSSFGLWFGAYAESLVDDLTILSSAYKVTNRNPLGSGAGYGSSFALDRELTTKLLEFDSPVYNSVYAQMGRGKTEKAVAFGISTIGATLSRLSMDCCLYLSQNFNFISFPSELTTGSSIMPHKKNPDVFELIRAKCNRLQSVPNELSLLITNLPSGYHRDMQLTKEILFPAIEDLKSCIKLCILMLENISVNDGILNDPKYQYLYTVEAVNELVKSGTPFRDAYRQVGEQVEKGTFKFDTSRALEHSHIGSLGNLSNEKIKALMDSILKQFTSRE